MLLDVTNFAASEEPGDLNSKRRTEDLKAQK